jgi:hypothetical protein
MDRRDTPLVSRESFHENLINRRNKSMKIIPTVGREMGFKFKLSEAEQEKMAIDMYRRAHAWQNEMRMKGRKDVLMKEWNWSKDRVRAANIESLSPLEQKKKAWELVKIRDNMIRNHVFENEADMDRKRELKRLTNERYRQKLKQTPKPRMNIIHDDDEDSDAGILTNESPMVNPNQAFINNEERKLQEKRERKRIVNERYRNKLREMKMKAGRPKPPVHKPWANFEVDLRNESWGLDDLIDITYKGDGIVNVNLNTDRIELNDEMNMEIEQFRN